MIVVMRCAADISLLRDDGMRPEIDRRGIVNFSLVGECATVFADKIPRRPNFAGGIKMTARTHLCAEDTQQHGTPRVHWPRRWAVEEQVNDLPKQPRDSMANSERCAMIWIVHGTACDVMDRALAAARR